jgi:hypothetical protein
MNGLDETDSLHTRFRPTRFKDVIGNEDEVQVLGCRARPARPFTYRAERSRRRRWLLSPPASAASFGMSEIDHGWHPAGRRRAVEDATIWPRFCRRREPSSPTSATPKSRALAGVRGTLKKFTGFLPPITDRTG